MNPFSTRYIRPGALDFIFPQGQSAATLIEQLRAAGWRGQIIGPHGSGKTTLLAALLPLLTAAGREVVLRQFRAPGQAGSEHEAGDTGRRADIVSGVELGETAQLVIDGYEQLSWWARRRVEHSCGQHRTGLLVTAHQDMGLPTLWTTQPTLELTQQVVGRLVGPDDNAIQPPDVAAAWQRTKGNLRETLFTLYDVYQGRQS